MGREILPGWRVRYLADGLLLSPAGPPEGRSIRIQERLPLRPAHAVIAAARAQLPGADLALSAIERVITQEGEFAIRCALRGADACRALGMVWGDHFYTQIDGAARPADFAEVEAGVRDLTAFHALGLGELRRRRYLYTPPPGWRAYPRGLTAEWYAPGFPGDHGFISAFAARPGGETLTSQLDRVLHEMSWFGFRRDASEPGEAMSTDDGTAGHAWTITGRYAAAPPMVFKVVVLSDHRFQYPLRLEATPAAFDRHVEAFDAMIRSIQRLPAPTRDASSPFVHWAV